MNRKQKAHANKVQKSAAKRRKHFANLAAKAVAKAEYDKQAKLSRLEKMRASIANWRRRS